MAQHQRPDAEVLLAQLLEAEDLYRNHRRTSLSIKNAKFRYQASMQQIICSKERNLSKEQLNYYLDGSFIDRVENIIISPVPQAVERATWPRPSAIRPAPWAKK